MALKSYKISEAIQVIYQAAGAATGLTVDMQIYDETGAAFTTAPQAMAEIGATGRYQASFTPDAQGEWHAQLVDSGGGKALKQFSIGAYNVDSVGGLVGTVNTNVGTVDTKVVAVQTVVDTTKTNVIATLTAVQNLDTDIVAVQTAVDVTRVNTVAILTAVQGIDLELDTLVSPPMVG